MERRSWDKYPPHYAQVNYSKIHMVHETIAESGCATISVCMWANAMGLNISPPKWNSRVQKLGGYNSKDWFDWSVVTRMPEFVEYTPAHTKYTIKKAAQLLDQHGPIIIRVRYRNGTGNNHFVLGLEYSAGDIRIHDPGSRYGDANKNTSYTWMSRTARKSGLVPDRITYYKKR